MASTTVNVFFRGEWTDLKVYYDYDYTPAVHTLSNGDPGYPSESDFEITSVELDGEDVTEEISKCECWDDLYAQASDDPEEDEYDPEDFYERD